MIWKKNQIAFISFKKIKLFSYLGPLEKLNKLVIAICYLIAFGAIGILLIFISDFMPF